MSSASQTPEKKRESPLAHELPTGKRAKPESMALTPVDPDRVWAFQSDCYEIIVGKPVRFVGSFVNYSDWIKSTEAPREKGAHALRMAGLQCIKEDGTSFYAGRDYLRALLTSAATLPQELIERVRVEAEKSPEYRDLGHGETVDHCLKIALSHGYTIMMGGETVLYDEAKDKVVHGPSLPLERTIKVKGVKNSGFPRPYDTVKATESDANQQIKCACGKTIGGYSCYCSGVDKFSSACTCKTRIGRDLVHVCAILNCKHRTCNTMQCPVAHFESAHTSSVD